MTYELIASFLWICFIYALDELFLIDQQLFKRLTLYKDEWKGHFRMNPLMGTVVGFWMHSIIFILIGYLAFSVVQDLFYQIIKKLKGLPFNWKEYVPTWHGIPKYYFFNTGIILVLLYIKLYVGWL